MESSLKKNMWKNLKAIVVWRRKNKMVSGAESRNNLDKKDIEAQEIEEKTLKEERNSDYFRSHHYDMVFKYVINL